MKIAIPVSMIAASLVFAANAHAFGANSDNNLKERVAQQVMQDTHKLTDASSITLMNVKRGAFSVKWEADTPNGHYACSGDDMLRNASCTRVDVPSKENDGKSSP